MTDEDPMPPSNDAKGMEEWHHRHGLPWGQRYRGPDPIVVRRMAPSVLQNLSVHLGNEHRINPDGVRWEQLSLRHLLAHLYAEFREGQAHYHEQSQIKEHRS